MLSFEAGQGWMVRVRVRIDGQGFNDYAPIDQLCIRPLTSSKFMAFTNSARNVFSMSPLDSDFGFDGSQWEVIGLERQELTFWAKAILNDLPQRHYGFTILWSNPNARLTPLSTPSKSRSCFPLFRRSSIVRLR
jgi:hypothetical protein